MFVLISLTEYNCLFFTSTDCEDIRHSITKEARGQKLDQNKKLKSSLTEKVDDGFKSWLYKDKHTTKPQFNTSVYNARITH